MDIKHTPSKELLLSARIAFLQQGSSLNRWCRENSIHPSYAYQALTGKGSYPAILAFRQRVLIAAGLMAQPAATTRRRKSA